MDHHVDIDLRPDPEFAPHQLMSALYAKLHRGLVALNATGVGVSFPGFDTKAPHLGNRLRLHGDLAALSELMSTDWLSGMRDHVTSSPPTPVPPTAKHRPVRRVQSKSNPERLRRRLMRRQDIDEQQARARIPDTTAEFMHLPFVQLRSTSTGQTFRLFVAHGSLQDEPAAGQFNFYGLSQHATVPWF